MKSFTLFKFKTGSLIRHASLLFFLPFAVGTVALGQTWDRDTNTEVVPVEGTGGRVWMDRNLGATNQALINSTDETSYGFLFQWGRNIDGHEERDSGESSSRSNSDQPENGGEFITTPGASDFDWRNPPNDDLWQGVGGINNPCPIGYRIPTVEEWTAEYNSWNTQDQLGAINSPLRLPRAGSRAAATGDLQGVNTELMYWASTPADPSQPEFSRSLVINNEPFPHTQNLPNAQSPRASGFSVRCISVVDADDQIDLGNALNTILRGDATTANTASGFTGEGYITGANAANSGFTIEVPQDFEWLSFRYSNSGGATDYRIIVSSDGDFSAAAGGDIYTFTDTGSEDNWAQFSAEIEATKGQYVHVKWEGPTSGSVNFDFGLLTDNEPPPPPPPGLEGLGTLGEPYLISTVAHLKWVRDNTNEGNFDWNAGDIYFEQQNDIDLDGINWEPIGEPGNAFEGIYDGGGYLIENLIINRGSENNIGLFGKTDGATITNLGVINANITAQSEAGVLVGYMASGTIQNCFSQGEINADFGPVGGLVGRSLGNIQNSYAQVDVTANNASSPSVAAGGLFGLGGSGDIQNSYAAGKIEANTGTDIYGLGADDGTLVTYSNLFYDNDLSSNLSLSPGDPGAASTTTQMQQQSTFTGWDFQCETTNGTDNIWGIDEGNDYPVLSVFGFEQDCCRNPDNGGEIGSAQTICSGDTPDQLTSTSEVSGHVGGDLEYQWQSSITSSSAGFTDIVEATGATYSPGVLTQTTWYRRLARVSCKEDWGNATSSNVIEITVDALQQFRSKNSGNWNDAANWEQFDGTDWTDATTYPGEISNECPDPMVTIKATHAMEIASSDEIDIPNLKIKANGNLTIKSGGKLTIQNKLELDEQQGAAIVVE